LRLGVAVLGDLARGPNLIGMAILKDAISSIMIAVAALIGADAKEGLDGGL
jgi:hypothetical protein